jgi:transcriptional regulator with XRE-family HTH domain
MDVNELMQRAGESPSHVARRAGVSRSTVKRIADREVTPSLHSLKEIALALGLDIDVRVWPASDPVVATAVRSLLDAAVMGSVCSESRDVAGWLARFERWGVTEPEELVETAGAYSNPSVRHGAIFFAPAPEGRLPHPLATVASAGRASRAGWAIYGVFAGAELTNAVDPLPGPTVLWAEQPRVAAGLLSQSMPRRETFQPNGVVVVKATGTELVDLLEVGPIKFVSPIQAVIDLHGLDEHDLARTITDGW